jgi:outer membrane lipoprotein SlyB
MDAERKTSEVREAVGVFADANAFQGAIDDLLSSGFDRAELSLLAAKRTVVEKLGHPYEKVAEIEDNPAAPRCCYISTEDIGDAEGGLIGGLLYVGAAAGAFIASGGTLAAAIAAAAIGGGVGGLIGSVLAKLVGDRHAQHLQEQLDQGGLLLWVRTRDADREKRAVDILAKHSGRDVHVHALPGAQPEEAPPSWTDDWAVTWGAVRLAGRD